MTNLLEAGLRVHSCASHMTCASTSLSAKRSVLYDVWTDCWDLGHVETTRRPIAWARSCVIGSFLVHAFPLVWRLLISLVSRLV